MSTYLLYAVAFLLIGLFAGHASKADMPGGAFISARVNYLVAVVGALLTLAVYRLFVSREDAH